MRHNFRFRRASGKCAANRFDMNARERREGEEEADRAETKSNGRRGQRSEERGEGRLRTRTLPQNADNARLTLTTKKQREREIEGPRGTDERSRLRQRRGQGGSVVQLVYYFCPRP